MPTCNFTHVFRSNRKKRRNLQAPTPIHLRARTIDDLNTSRIAILSCDTASDSNVISHQLVTNVLGEKYHQIRRDDTISIPRQLCGEHVDGYIDLDWCWDNRNDAWYNTRFLVTRTHDPPYDAVLGRKDAEYHGILRRRSKR